MNQYEKFEREQKRQRQKLKQLNNSKIKKIYAALKVLNVPHIVFNESVLHDRLGVDGQITTDTKLTFTETRCGEIVNVIEVRYRHFLERGFPVKSDNRIHFFYVAIFKNLQTSQVHTKIGITGRTRPIVRFQHTATDDWEFVGYLCEPRSGTKAEILALEKQAKSYCKKHDLFESNVQNFSYGGRTEVLKANLSIRQLANVLTLIEDRGFDSLGAQQPGL